MSEHHHQHHLFGHHKDDQPPPPEPAEAYSADNVTYQQTEYFDGPRRPDDSTVETSDVYVQTTGGGDEAHQKALKEGKSSGRKEHFGELGASAAGAFAMYERHEGKKDPEHAGRHKLEERIAEGVALGAGGYAIHEHHEKKEVKNDEEESEGHKKHHHFF